MITFQKVRFTSKNYGATAGLIFETHKLREFTVSGISRLFPYSESMKIGGKRYRIETTLYPTGESHRLTEVA